MHALIVGVGDSGARIAQGARERGWQTSGLVRSAASRDRACSAGVELIDGDLDAPLPRLPDADFIFYCAPPPPQGDDDPRLARLLAAYPPATVRRLIYISTSGVYGDCGGAWVSETRATNPGTARARRRVAAETQIAAWGGDYAILRAPGIYGPGRLPIQRLRAGEPVLSDAAGPWVNRIHVADLAAIALAAAERGPAQAVYHAADGQPLPMGAYYRLLARCIGCPEAPEIDWSEAERAFSPTRLSFLRESRRLSNQRLREQLAVPLHYPDAESGLLASLAAPADP